MTNDNNVTNTEGGSKIDGNVNVGNDFVGRDKIEYHYYYPNENDDTSVTFIDMTPPPSRYFVGHRELLNNLKDKIISNGKPVIAFIGMGGIGRKALLSQLSYEIKMEFPGGIFWATLDSQQTAISNLKLWSKICGVEPASDESTLIHFVRNMFAIRSQKIGSSMFVINCEVADGLADMLTLKQVLPHNVPIMLTARAQSQIANVWPETSYINIPGLTHLESLTLLKAYAGQSIDKADPKEVSKLLDLVGGLPLAIEAIGSLLAKYANKPGPIISQVIDRFEHKLGYTHVLEIAFSICFESLTDKAKIVFCCFGLLKECYFTIRDIVALLQWEEDLLDGLLDEVVLAGLAAWGVEHHSYQLHRLVHTYARTKLRQFDRDSPSIN